MRDFFSFAPSRHPQHSFPSALFPVLTTEAVVVDEELAATKVTNAHLKLESETHHLVAF